MTKMIRVEKEVIDKIEKDSAEMFERMFGDLFRQTDKIVEQGKKKAE